MWPVTGGLQWSEEITYELWIPFEILSIVSYCKLYFKILGLYQSSLFLSLSWTKILEEYWHNADNGRSLKHYTVEM